MIRKNKSMRRTKHIHMVGIGGAGMGGIAEVLLNLGYTVSGSDCGKNKMTQYLEKCGANIFLGHQAQHIQEADVIVVSSAIAVNNVEVMAAKKSYIPVISRAEMLGELMRFSQGIAVAGTHGKTTTSSLISSIFDTARLDPTFVIGGLLHSAGSNARLGQGKYFIAEADESDASFLYLKPVISVVTNIDADHMATYNNNFNELKQTFVKFLHLLPFYGLAVLCLDDPEVRDILSLIDRPVLSYGFNEGVDIQAVNFRQKGLLSYFSVVGKGYNEKIDYCLNLPGKHNVLNALAAIAVATEAGIDEGIIAETFQQFSGVGRRLQQYGEFLIGQQRVTLIDDYGHHPREVAATILALRQAFPTRRLVMVYQPHRYTRTRDLFDNFVEALAQTDILLLLDIYAAGEESIEGIDSKHLCQSISQKNHQQQSIYVGGIDHLHDTLLSVVRDGDIVLTQGAGDVGKICPNFGRYFDAVDDSGKF